MIMSLLSDQKNLEHSRVLHLVVELICFNPVIKGNRHSKVKRWHILFAFLKAYVLTNPVKSLVLIVREIEAGRIKKHNSVS